MLAQLNLQMQNDQLIAQLMEMGFSRPRVERAIKAAGTDFERCSQWLVETIEDAVRPLFKPLIDFFFFPFFLPSL
jgi:uncharacterized UBP type Zn finger protein